MGVRLGIICVMIGLSLMFLVFFVYVFDKEKFVHICFITTLLSVKSFTFHIVLVHELAGGSAVDECRSRFDFCCVHGLDLYFNG